MNLKVSLIVETYSEPPHGSKKKKIDKFKKKNKRLVEGYKKNKKMKASGRI